MTDSAADTTSVPGELDPLDSPPPAFGAHDAERLAADVFGVDATGSPLVSERDQNVRLVTDDGSGFVLKTATPPTTPA